MVMLWGSLWVVDESNATRHNAVGGAGGLTIVSVHLLLRVGQCTTQSSTQTPTDQALVDSCLWMS